MVQENQAPQEQKLYETVSAKVKTGGDFGKWGVEIFVARPIEAGSTAEAIDGIMADIIPKLDEYANIVSGKIELSTAQQQKKKAKGEREVIYDDIDPLEDEVLDDLNQLNSPIEPESEAKPEELLDDLEDLEDIEDIGEDELFEEEEPEPKKKTPERDPEGDANILDSIEDTPEEDIDEDYILALNRKQLVVFINQYELDVDAKEYPKLSDLRNAVLNDAFEEELPSDEELDTMSHEELIQLIDDLGMEIDTQKYKGDKEALCAKIKDEFLYAEDE